jgi:selenocysteine-specific elongation factor
MITVFSNYFADNEVLDLTQARAILDSSRRYVVPYLEYLDKHGYTSRRENGRVWRK